RHIRARLAPRKEGRSRKRTSSPKPALLTDQSGECSRRFVLRNIDILHNRLNPRCPIQDWVMSARPDMDRNLRRLWNAETKRRGRQKTKVRQRTGNCSKIPSEESDTCESKNQNHLEAPSSVHYTNHRELQSRRVAICASPIRNS